MKQLKQKLTDMSPKKTPPQASETGGRVTNNSVSKHRDEMFSRAKKFKYPFHRSKHRVALVSITLVLLALSVLGLFTSWRLYASQNTSEFTYRVTQILPFPVAKVDGKYTSYENYLFQLRYNIYWLEQFGTTDLRSPDGMRQIDYIKRLALDNALEGTIAKKFAKENGIKVSDEEIDEVVARVSTSGGDLGSILKEQYNLTEGEYRRLTKDEILKAKVAKVLDKEAPERAKKVLGQIIGGKDFAAAAKASSDDAETKQLGGEFGIVERGKANVPKEVSEKIFELKKGQVSEVIETPTDYWIVKVTDVVDKDRYKVSVIKIGVKDISSYIEQFKKDDKVKEYITLEEVNSQQAN
jgi:hypothetical protein